MAGLAGLRRGGSGLDSGLDGLRRVRAGAGLLDAELLLGLGVRVLRCLFLRCGIIGSLEREGTELSIRELRGDRAGLINQESGVDSPLFTG